MVLRNITESSMETSSKFPGVQYSQPRSDFTFRHLNKEQIFKSTAKSKHLIVRKKKLENLNTFLHFLYPFKFYFLIYFIIGLSIFSKYF